jgi:hypothetical protein
MLLNEKIKAYLAVNNIIYNVGDYETGETEGNPEEILVWNEANLGARPTQEQLDSAYTTQQANIIAAQNAATATKASALAKLTALGLTVDEIKAITGA